MLIILFLKLFLCLRLLFLADDIHDSLRMKILHGGLSVSRTCSNHAYFSHGLHLDTDWYTYYTCCTVKRKDIGAISHIYVQHLYQGSRIFLIGLSCQFNHKWKVFSLVASFSLFFLAFWFVLIVGFHVHSKVGSNVLVDT